MQVLRDRDDALYTKLVRLAGGNTDIVMQVLSKPSRSSVSLTTVIREIEELRDRRPGGSTRTPHRAAANR